MEIEKTKLEDVVLIKPDVFEDHRGEYVETYNNEKYGLDIDFVADCISVSHKRVLRGIHGDDKTWKLIDCLYGRIYLVIVNCDRYYIDSVTGHDYTDTFGKWESFTLSDKNRHQVLVPPKHGVAHLVLSKTAIFHYKQSEYYNPDVLKQFTYRYDDPRFNIWWPNITPILSERDEKTCY